MDAQFIKDVVQFLATYGQPAGIAAAQTLGSSAAVAIKDLWGKIWDKSKQEGGIDNAIIAAFERNPQDIKYQRKLASVIEQFCDDDPAFAKKFMTLGDVLRLSSNNFTFTNFGTANGVVGNADQVTMNFSASHTHHHTEEKISLDEIPCPVCGKKMLKVHSKSSSSTILECDNCSKTMRAKYEGAALASLAVLGMILLPTPTEISDYLDHHASLGDSVSSLIEWLVDNV